jgi:hypothetical protein
VDEMIDANGEKCKLCTGRQIDVIKIVVTDIVKQTMEFYGRRWGDQDIHQSGFKQLLGPCWADEVHLHNQ